jgi:3'-phosphoadenosine 5'-phosphosulfate sulfotransferase (PAPS reductase)/FAD synthetase
MNAVLRETFLLHAETEGYLKAERLAREIVAEATRKYKKPYIAFSGGKDSTVMLHLVLQQAPKTLVFHWDYGQYYTPREIELETIDIAHRIGAQNIRTDSSPLYEKHKRTPANVFYRVFFGRTQKELVNEGYDLAFIGIRSGESTARKFKIRGNPFRWNNVLEECYPVHHFTARDVWAYIASHDLPYCSHYDRYGSLEGYENVRFCTYFDPEFAKLGRGNVDGVLMPEFRNV